MDTSGPLTLQLSRQCSTLESANPSSSLPPLLEPGLRANERLLSTEMVRGQHHKGSCLEWEQVRPWLRLPTEAQGKGGAGQKPQE